MALWCAASPPPAGRPLHVDSLRREGTGGCVQRRVAFGSVLLDAGALSPSQLREAAELLGHLNEAWFGYRSGDPLRPSSGEPPAGFDPALTTLAARLEANAAEPGCSVWRL